MSTTAGLGIAAPRLRCGGCGQFLPQAYDRLRLYHCGVLCLNRAAERQKCGTGVWSFSHHEAEAGDRIAAKGEQKMREGEKRKPRLLPEVKRARDQAKARAQPPANPAFLAAIGAKGGRHSGEVRKAKAALLHVGEVQLWFGAWVPEAVGTALRADCARLGRPMGQYLAQILTDYCEVRRRPKVRLRREFPKPW